jgi:hypothetical protein
MGRPGWIMSTATAPTPATARRGRKFSTMMSIVFLIVFLSVTASYEWGAPTPQFRPDALFIIAPGIVIAAVYLIVYLVIRYGGQTPIRVRLCTSCGRGIPFDALFCPYCGFQFPRP